MKRFRRRWRAALVLVAATALVGTATAAADPGPSSPRPSLEASKSRVTAGARVKLRGRFPAAREPAQESSGDGERGGAPSSRGVRIEFRPRGGAGWRKAKTTSTRPDGSYRERVKVRRTGRFRAVHEDGRITRAESVRAKSKLRAAVRRRHTTLGQRVPVSGTVRPTGSRRKVVVRIGGDRLRARTNRRGRFRVRWKADRTGAIQARVRAKGDRIAAGSRTKAGRTTVYRPAIASWYGPGFYGNRTACGQTLTTATIGVAHKTMPCGTKLTLRYRGRSVRVRVIDRGPYVHGREFDLTGATRARLGFPSLGKVLSSR